MVKFAPFLCGRLRPHVPVHEVKDPRRLPGRRSKRAADPLLHPGRVARWRRQHDRVQGRDVEALVHDAALERRFQKVYVAEPTVEETVSILRGLKEKYDVHHGVRIQDNAIVAAATLSARYITDRFLPDKAIDLIDEAAAKIKIADNCRQISQEAIQLHGGMGMTEELKISHTFRRLTMIGQRFGANVKIVEVPPGPPVLSPLVAEIYGPSQEGQIELARQIKGIFENTDGVVDIDADGMPDFWELAHFGDLSQPGDGDCSAHRGRRAGRAGAVTGPAHPAATAGSVLHEEQAVRPPVHCSRT